MMGLHRAFVFLIVVSETLIKITCNECVALITVLLACCVLTDSWSIENTKNIIWVSAMNSLKFLADLFSRPMIINILGKRSTNLCYQKAMKILPNFLLCTISIINFDAVSSTS